MKNKLAYLLICCFALSMVGCNSSNNNSTHTESEVIHEKRVPKLTDEMIASLPDGRTIPDSYIESIFHGSPEFADYVKNIVGTEAKDFEFISSDGVVHSLSEYKGKPILLEIMATWCSTCEKTIPAVEQFTNANPNLPILSISLDETPEDIASFFKEKGMGKDTYTVDLSKTDLREMYDVQFVPTFFFIDGNGIIQFAYVGEVEAGFLKDLTKLTLNVDTVASLNN